MLPARKPTKKQVAFASRIRRAIMNGKTVKRADLLKAIDIEASGTRWRKQQNEAARAATT